MDVGVIRIQALVGREARPEREIALVAPRERLDVERSQQLLQRTTVRVERLVVTLHTPARQVPKVFRLQFAIDAGEFVGDLLHRELESGAPLSKCGLRFGKHERDAADRREIDFAARTVQRVIERCKRGPVAARTGEQCIEIRHGKRLCMIGRRPVSTKRRKKKPVAGERLAVALGRQNPVLCYAGAMTPFTIGAKAVRLSCIVALPSPWFGNRPPKSPCSPCSAM